MAESMWRTLTVDSFEGVNFTDNPGNVDIHKSPDAPNMIRDVPGKVRKCMGYEKMAEYRDSQGGALAINGWHCRAGDDNGLIHAGTNIYRGDTLLYEQAADTRSRSWQMSWTDIEAEEAVNKRLLVLQDGKALLIYDGETVQTATARGYVPTLTIAKSPAGGGADYEALNLISPAFEERFAGTSDAVRYQLTFGSLDETAVQAWVMNSAGKWVEKTEGTDFSVDRTDGIVSFVTSPGLSPLTGEDNVKIRAFRTVDGYAERVNKCRCGVLFGVGGNADRLFVSGNPDGELLHCDWYSGQNDPTYWPDVAYCTVGSGASAVVGYAIVDNYLATFKDEREPDRNVVLREGDLTDGEPAFPVVNTLQGPGAVAPFSFGYLATEPLFLTRLGVCALTTSDVSGNRYSQSRSYYLDGKLRRESGLENAFGLVHNDLYWLCLNGKAYILDGLQALSNEQNAPYSTRQYAGFYRTNLPARVMWEQNGELWFGSEVGNVYRFFADPDNPASYTDDGAPIAAWWTTPYLFGGAFDRNKDFRNPALLLSAAAVTSAEMELLDDGKWKKVGQEAIRTRYFSWIYLLWNKWSWQNDDTPRTVQASIRLKKVSKAQLRFVNREKNESFGAMRFDCEYRQGSRYKG